METTTITLEYLEQKLQGSNIEYEKEGDRLYASASKTTGTGFRHILELEIEKSPDGTLKGSIHGLGGFTAVGDYANGDALIAVDQYIMRKHRLDSIE